MSEAPSNPIDNIDTAQMLATAKKKGILLTLSVVLIAATGAYFLGVFDGGGSVAVAAPQTEAAGGGSWNEGPIMDGGDFVVNLADRDKQRYAKIKFSLVMAEDVDLAAAQVRLALIKDRIMPFLMSKTSRELSTPDGFKAVRQELTEHARDVYHGQALRAVITELIVQ